MSLNFDSYGNEPTDPNYDGSQLGSMKLYNLKIQKLKDVFTDYDAVTKKYVDSKINDLLNGAGSAYDTLKEIETAIKGADNNIVGGMLKEISDLSGAVTAERGRALGIESGLASRIATLEADPSTGASVTAVENELNYVEAAAGLSAGGNYTADPNTTYLSLAVSLKDADTKLDTQLKAEETRASGAESTIATNLATHIANYETEHKSNDQDKNAIGQRITDLTTFDIAEDPDKLFYTDARVKSANVHEYANWDPNNRVRDPTYEMTTSYAFGLLKHELNDIHAKEDTNDSRHNDDVIALNNVVNSLNSEITTARAEEQKVQSDVNAKDSAMSGRVAVFEGQLNNGNVEGTEYYVDNLSVQGVVDDLRGAIDYVNGERVADKTIAETRHSASEGKHADAASSISGLAEDKYDKEGGAISGDATFQSNVNLQVQHANQDETIYGTGKYLYFSNNWRLYGKSDGSRLVFEYNSGTLDNPSWKSAVPFISSV